MDVNTKFASVILLGGKSRRLDGIDKSGLIIGEQSCLERTSVVLGRGVEHVVVSVADNNSPALPSDLERIKDVVSPDGQGGVALAILACLKWAAESALNFVITSPVDTPFLPYDFVSQLTQRYKTSDAKRPIAAQSDERLHGLHALWPTCLLPDLHTLVVRQNIY